MKVAKKILIVITTIIIINVTQFMSKLSSEEAATSVSLSIVTQPYVDVVVARSKTNTDLSTFKNDLLSSLSSKGVKTENDWVKITAIESHKVNIQDSFTWKEDKSSSIGNITITEGGKNVEMIGNPSLPGKNAIWITPEEDLDQTFTFNYNIVFGDSFNAAGMLLRVKEEESQLTGYMLSFNNSYSSSGSPWTSLASGQSGAIWKFTYTRNANDSNIQKELVMPLEILRSGELTVRASRTEIEVSGGGLSETAICDLDDPMGTGFGFFSDHYSHGCDSIGSFKLSDINLKTESSKRLEEVLRAPDWRENSIKVLVNVEDYKNKQLSNPEGLGELLTRTINEEIYFVGWGNSDTQSQINQLIEANNNKGKYINNSSYSNSINQTAAYIKTLLPTTSGTNYIVLGENTTLTSSNSSLMKNTAYGSYPNGRWKIVHDCEYYENNLGQFQKSGRYLSNMITSFDKTGKYEITYEDNPTNPNIIYVHRKPVAEIEVQRSGTNITLINKGFDWDHRSEANNGVVQEEWKWRKVGDTTWNNGKLTSISAYDNYLVQLRVKDKEGVWSMPTSKYITKVTDIPPIASFKLENNVLSIYENLNIQDGSYDPYGRSIIKREWKVLKNGTEVYKGSTPKLNFMDKGSGKYTMSLTVTNSEGQVSEEYTRNFEIRPDDEAPEVTISPTQCNWTGSVDVTYSFKDRLGSQYRSHKYAITNSTATPSSSSWKSGPSNNKVTINTPGEWYLHIISTDNAGNTSEDRVVGVYKIDGINPTGTLSHAPTDWTNQDVTISYSFTDAESGLKNVKLPDGTVVTNGTGTYTVPQNGTYKFVATDIAGNSAEFTETITNIDKLKPTVTLNPNGGNKYVMPTTGKAKIKTVLTAADAAKTANDGKSDLKTLQYAWSQSNTVEPTGWTNFTNGATITKSDITSAGTWYLWTKVTDNAGNRADMVKVSNAFTIIANTDPKAEITLTPDKTKWTNTNVVVTATYGEYLTQNKTLTCDGTVNTNYTLNKTNIASGTATATVKTNERTVTATAEDIAGNKITKTYKVTNIDKLKPTVSLNPNGGNKYVMPTTGKAKIKTVLTAADAAKTANDGKSDLKTLQYAWSQSNTVEPTGWTNFTNGATITKSDITSAGTWYLWTKVTDNAGNRATTVKVSNAFTIIANTEGPALITLTPDKTAWTNTNVVVTAEYGEYLTKNRTLTCDGTVNTNYTLNKTNIASGTATATVKTNERTVTATAEDIAGNKITKTYKVTNIDKLKPTVSLNPNGGNKYVMPTTGNAKIKTVLTAADATKTANDGKSDLKTLQYAWSQSNTQEPTGWTNFTNGATITKSDITSAGTWYLWTKVTDNAGNRATTVKVSNAFTIIANTEGPALITLTPDKTAWTNTNVVVTAEYGEYLTKNRTLTCDGTVNTNYTLNKTNIASGIATATVKTNERIVTATAEDIAGNKITKTYKVTNIDKLKPTVSLNPNGGNKYVMPTTGNAKIKTVLTAADATKTANDGKSDLKTLQYAWSQSNTQEPTGWTNFTNGATITKSDITSAGTWYLWTKVTDNAGNRATTVKVSNAFTIIANTEGPALITLTPDKTAWTNTNVVVTAEYGEYLTKNRTLTCDGTVNTNYTLNKTNIASGIATATVKTNERTVTATAEDIAGNKIVKTYKVTNIDKILPVENITHTPIDWVIDYVTINWKFTDEQSGIKEIQLPNGQKTTNTSGKYVVYDNGNYNFTAYDIAGNVKSVTETINNIDKIKPEGVLSLSTNDLSDSEIQINWEAIDHESGFSKILLPDATVSKNSTGNFKITKMGTYTFIIYDVVGNERELSIEVNNVDVEQPNLVVTQNVTRWTNEDIDLHYKATDYQSGLKEVVLPNSEQRVESEGDYLATQNGIYTFLAYDNVGNGILVRHEVSNIDKTAPLLILKTETNDNGNIDIIWEASDTQSGLRNIILPNGQSTSDKNGRYETTQNGTYTFIAYDNVGNDVFMKIDVNDIDRQGIEFELWQEESEDDNYKICWKVLDEQDDYKHILLPNDTYSTKEEGYFLTKEEGIYTFQAYDNAGNESVKTIKIKNNRQNIAKKIYYMYNKNAKS